MGQQVGVAPQLVHVEAVLLPVGQAALDEGLGGEEGGGRGWRVRLGGDAALEQCSSQGRRWDESRDLSLT